MAQSIEIKVDQKQLRSLITAFQRFPDETRKAMRVGLATAAGVVEREARLNHRYKTRSGNLERNTTSELFRGKQLASRVFVNDERAEYGKYIHGGFKTWSPDKFLFKALRNKEEEVFRIIDRAMGKAVERLNNG